MKTLSEIRNESADDTVESEDLSEALRSEYVNKFKQLSQVGLIPKDKLQMLVRAFGKADVDDLSYSERLLVIEVFRNLVDHIVGDRQLFQKVKMSFAKEELDTEDEKHNDLLKKGYKRKPGSEPIYQHPDKPPVILVVKDGRVVKSFGEEVKSTQFDDSKTRLRRDKKKTEPGTLGAPMVTKPVSTIHSVQGKTYEVTSDYTGGEKEGQRHENHVVTHANGNKVTDPTLHQRLKNEHEKAVSQKDWYNQYSNARSDALQNAGFGKNYGRNEDISEDFEASEPKVKNAFPVVVVLRRKSIRTFSDGKKAALYYADKLKRYFTVPSTGDIVSEENEDSWSALLDEAQNNVSQASSEQQGSEPPAVLSSTAQNIHALRAILTNKQNARLKFNNGRSMTVDPLTAHVLLHAHGRLSEPENKLDFERTLDKSPEHFMRMSKFASRHYVSDK